ncbi:MAG: hypothetical protein NZM04_04275 [Methylacidiphilales bacterium]|nr:hypothetical protein [Candidatus Methylacidiphilales bacterium]MDW8349680.1 hypothetical protein [Verrucomicrobiae bacterium]
MNPNTGQVVWSTYFGAENTILSGVSVYGDDLFVSGIFSNSSNSSTSFQRFVTTGVHKSQPYSTNPQNPLADRDDAFLAKINSNSGSIIWSTRFGGINFSTPNNLSEYDAARGNLTNDLTVDVHGNPIITGTTNSREIGTTPGAYIDKLSTNNTINQTYVAKFNNSDGKL